MSMWRAEFGDDSRYRKPTGQTPPAGPRRKPPVGRARPHGTRVFQANRVVATSAADSICCQPHRPARGSVSPLMSGRRVSTDCPTTRRARHLDLFRTAANSRKTTILSRATLRPARRAAFRHRRPAPGRARPPAAAARGRYSTADPLQRGGQKPQLRVAFDLGKPVAVDAQRAVKTVCSTTRSRHAFARAPVPPGPAPCAAPSRPGSDVSIPSLARAARARTRSNFGSSFEGSSTNGTRASRT
jgi:hypothetical protein